MKKLLFCLSFLAVIGMAAGQKTVHVVSSDMGQSRLVFVTPTVAVDTIVAEGTVYGQILLEGFALNAPVGTPALPVYGRTIEIPVCSDIQVEVVSSQVKMVSAASLGLPGPVAPRQPSRRKSDTTAPLWVRNDALYATDTFCGNPVVQVHRMGVLRDRNLAVVTYSPVRYNPATGMVELYSQVEVVLHYQDADIAATRQLHHRYYSEVFAPQSDLLVTLPGAKIDHAATAPIRYLIVCHSSFRGQMDDFVAWKRRKGFLTDIVYTGDAEVGTTASSIADYVKSQYTNATADNPAPTYLLLVGDVEQIPPFAASNEVDNGHVTDLYYATWTDGDFLPDCYYGRFSAQTVDQLTPQIEKTLLYEQYGFEDPSYLSRAILVAGVDYNNPDDNAYRYGDPAMDYAAKVYCNANNGFSSLIYYKNNSSYAPEGVTVTGKSGDAGTAEALRTYYNEGAGWVNYSAHGAEDSWTSPYLNVDHVEAMSNFGKPMFMVGNCCLTNYFNISACFGETLLRRMKNAGAVVYIGGSDYTYWHEDFCWSVGSRSNIYNTMNASYRSAHLGTYDRLFHTHGEAVAGWRTSAGAIVSAGNMAVMDDDATSMFVKYYWEIYHVMGDPSVEPWLGEAEVMSLLVGSPYRRGSGPLQVTAVPYAYVALTNGNGRLVAAAYADAQGEARLEIPTTIALGQYELAVTAQGYQPAFRPVEVSSPSGAALVLVSFEEDAPLEAADTVTFSLRVANGAESASQEVVLFCRSSDMAKLRLLDDQVSLSSVGGHDTVTSEAAFRGVVDSSVGDGDQVTLQVYMVEEGDTSRYDICVSLRAPIPEVTGYAVSGNVEPGDTVLLSVLVRNRGHASVKAADLSLRHFYGLATVLSEAYLDQVIAPNETLTVIFQIAFPNTLTPTAGIPFLFELTSPSASLTYTVRLSYDSFLLVDFDEVDLDELQTTMGYYAWELDESEHFSGTHSLRSAHSLPDRCSSRINIVYTTEYDDSVSFYAKVSSEEDYDWFTFSIDNVPYLELSGEVDWTRYVYPLSAGRHTLTFRYKKDNYVESGADAAWIDNIELPKSVRPILFLSDTVCQYSDYAFAGESVPTETLGTTMWVDTTEDRITNLLLTVLPVPEVTIAVSSESVMSGESVLLTASGASRYEWSTGDRTEAIQVTPNVTTTYFVTGYQGGCSSTAQATVRVTVGISDVTEEEKVLLYPNPASSDVFVLAPAMRRVVVYDVSGRVTHVASTQDSRLSFSVQGWPRGVYILRAELPQGVVMRRLVVK